MKRLIALLLALTVCLGLLAACGKTEPQNEDPKVEDDGVMKILLIGHSTGVDSAYMLPAIAKNEGVENLVVGMLYHSGCRLGQHVEYLQSNAKQYAYYEMLPVTLSSVSPTPRTISTSRTAPSPRPCSLASPVTTGILL